jgi:hypothetical protein
MVVFLTEQTAAVVDQQRWLHEAVYTFRHEAGAELNFTVPEGAHIVSAALDGAVVSQLLSELPRLALPLPNRAGVRRLHLRWTYGAGRESLTAPNLDRPRLDGARDGPVLYAVLTPPGFESVPGGTDLKPGAAAGLRRHPGRGGTPGGRRGASLAGGTGPTALRRGRTRRSRAALDAPDRPGSAAGAEVVGRSCVVDGPRNGRTAGLYSWLRVARAVVLA